MNITNSRKWFLVWNMNLASSFKKAKAFLKLPLGNVQSKFTTSLKREYLTLALKNFIPSLE